MNFNLTQIHGLHYIIIAMKCCISLLTIIVILHYLTVGSIQSAKETLAKMKYFVNINGQTKE